MKKIGVVGISGGWSTERLVEVIEKKCGSSQLIEMENVHLDSSKGKVFYNGMDLEEFDGLIIKKIGANYSPDYLDRLEILRYLDEKGTVRIFSKPERIIRILDRLSCTITLQSGGIPVPDTVITEDIEAARNAVIQFEKAVLKPLYSTKAKGMKVVENTDNLKSEIREFKESGNRVMYIQKMIDIPDEDYGLVFIGGKYVATYGRVKNDSSWNTTINSGGKYRAFDPTEEMIEMATKAQALFDLDFTCVDMAQTSEGLFVFEVSAFGGFRGMREANNLDAAHMYTEYVLEELNK